MYNTTIVTAPYMMAVISKLKHVQTDLLKPNGTERLRQNDRAYRVTHCSLLSKRQNHHMHRGTFGAGQCLWLNGPRAVLPKCVWSTFVSADVFSVLYFTQKFLSVSVLRHSVRRVLNRCVFQTVLLSCVRGAFVDSTGFDV